MIPVEHTDIDSLRGLPERDSDAWVLAHLGRQFPGSWLPDGLEQLIRSAEPHFRLRTSTSGRLDYIETITQWNRRIGAPQLQKDAVQASASLALAHHLRLPARVHLRGEREQGLLRAETA